MKLGLFQTLRIDLRLKAKWCYQSESWSALCKVLLTDGTMAMILYRLMQWSRRWHLYPLEMIFNKLNAICCTCIIGRGTEFGPGFVLIHSTGIVINGMVRGGSNVHLYHQVTLGLGLDHSGAPVLEDSVLIGAGAKVIGPVTIGTGARIGANAVVVHDVPPHATAVGVPARIVRSRAGESTTTGPESTPPHTTNPKSGDHKPEWQADERQS